ncbi:signal peptidase II [Curtobacterium sp. Leaf261]|nr:signal peptidase II [Curtobacterium sp. Leaf261]
MAALAFAAVCVYALDQGVKALVVRNLTLGETVPVLGRFLQLHYVTNPGAAFSFATGQTWIFSIVAAVVVVVIIVLARRIRSLWWALLFGMLLGGALGNLTDRLIREPGFGRGQVVDFIHTPWMMPAIYNIADSFICISMAVFVVLTILGVNLDGSRAVSKRKQAELDAAAAADAGREARVGSAESAVVADEPASGTMSGTSADVAEPSRASRPDRLGHDAT